MMYVGDEAVEVVEGWCLTGREGDEKGYSVIGFRLFHDGAFAHEMEGRKGGRRERHREDEAKREWDG